MALVEDYWIVVILCVRERRLILSRWNGRLTRKFHHGVEDVLEGDIEAGEDALDHYLIYVGGEMEERLPRSKDLRVQRRGGSDKPY